MEREDRARDRVETIKEDTRDLIDEGKERVQATGERAKRAVAGDEMPLGDRIASHAKELGHDLKANLDEASRKSRDAIEREP